MYGKKLTNLVMYVIMLVVFLGLINMIFNLHRFAFYGEFLVLIVLGGVALVSLLGLSNNSSWAWKTLKIFFTITFINMVFIYLIKTSEIALFLPLIIAVMVGFFISLVNCVNPKKEGEKVKKANSRSSAEKTVSTTHKPGKFIASKSGKKYHAPKCDWAKKIKKKNAIWYNSKADAKKAGYKADSCVKN